MKTRLALALAVAALAAGGALAQSEPIAIGASAPMIDVKMKNVDGRDVSIKDAAGPKGTLVVFTCNHCPFVKAWEERTVALGNAALKKGIGVIAINANDPEVAGDTFEAMQQRAKERGLAYPYAMDATSGIARAFGATRTPEFFLFDAAGKLVYHGAFDDNAQKPEEVKDTWLANAVDALASGKEIAVKQTKALGCSIKFRKQT